MPANKKNPSKAIQGDVPEKKPASAEPEKPEEFEEQRSTALRMKPQPIKPDATKS